MLAIRGEVIRWSGSPMICTKTIPSWRLSLRARAKSDLDLLAIRRLAFPLAEELLELRQPGVDRHRQRSAEGVQIKLASRRHARQNADLRLSFGCILSWLQVDRCQHQLRMRQQAPAEYSFHHVIRERPSEQNE
jgi:hypothetical protein